MSDVVRRAGVGLVTLLLLAVTVGLPLMVVLASMNEVIEP